MAEQELKKDPWLIMAAEAFQSSTSYMDNNYRKKWEDDIRHFQSRHHAASKYNKPSYQYRSKTFRPKTRSVIRNNEAAASAAFFNNMDFMSIEPQNQDDPLQKASADVMNALITYRLQESIPWFLICMGGFQDAQKVGVVCSYQDWKYREEQVKYEAIVTDENGEETRTPYYETEVVEDHPAITLLAIENVRIHPNASWTDPINTSPYLIILWPMYVKDVKVKMKDGNTKTGESKWKKLEDGEIRTATKLAYDSTRLVREENREDKAEKESGEPLSDFDVVWVHENFMSVNGKDVVYLTLGVEHMLTDPVHITKRYFHGERPVVMGIAIIDSHKIYPGGVSNLTSNTQKEINETANSRRDNVALVLNKRWFVKRGGQVDLKSMVRNVAGSVTMMDDVEKDAKPIEFHDVTNSAYMEQDRLNADFDELAGNFSASSISTNRRMNETVGGMNLLKAGTTPLVAYLIKTFGETWLEPVIKQIVKLEQKYESDQVVLALAAQKAQLLLKYGMNEITDDMLNQKLTTSVNAGIGATDPVMKLDRFLIATDKYTQFAERQSKLEQPILNMEEIGKEIYGRMGYKSGSRFIFQQQSPENQQLLGMVQQMNAAIKQLQAQLQDKQADRDVKLLETDIKESGADRRKSAELETRLVEKAMDLSNPVAGEQAR